MAKIISGSGGGCFLGNTLVTTPEGQVRIDEIKEGDLVVSFDDKAQLFSAKVIAVHVHENEKVYRYRLWGDTYLDATPNHWVLNQYNAFVCIGSLGPNDCLVDSNNHLRPIIDCTPLENSTVYNLTVENRHTFIANNIRVHNAGLGAGMIVGSGGGSKGGGGSPDVADDSLNSRAYVRIIDLISEGEIEGFPESIGYGRGTTSYIQAALKNIYFDKTSAIRQDASIGNVQNTDYNFKGVTENDFNIRWGTANQTYVPGYESAEDTYAVNVIVKRTAPVVRTITNSDINKVRIVLNWPALQIIQDDGDIVGAEVEYQIQIAYSGQPYITKVDTSVKGRTGDLYQKSHVIAFDDANAAWPVDVKVVRISKDSKNIKKMTEFSWSSYTEIIDVKLAYPNSALVAMQIDARSFSSIPARSYRIRGIKVKIPSNATVDQANGRLIYSGIWDGTFGAAQWTSDPVWCLYDLLINCRYGFGQNIPSRTLDKWSFYAASVYCNELVPTGRKDASNADILEPRFSCNVSIQTQDEAYKLINDMCSVFRAMPYWGAGTLIISQDAPSSPSYLFNQTNVGEEGFQYNGSSLKTRHTVAIVKYLDLENQKDDYISVEDQAGIAKYGVITTEIEAFACTSKSQARRIGEWILYTEQYETETITFKTSIDAGAAVRPGMVIATSDPLRAGARRGGRIRAAGTNYIVIDEPLATDIPMTGSPTINVAMIDGTVEVCSVVSASGAKITISGTFISTPLVGGTFIYNNDDMKRDCWRVLNVQEQNGAEYQITAIAYNASKYDHVERNVELNTKIYLPLEIQRPNDPQNISSQSATYQSNGQLSNKVVLSWESDSNATQYQVRYRLVG